MNLIYQSKLLNLAFGGRPIIHNSYWELNSIIVIEWLTVTLFCDPFKLHSQYVYLMLLICNIISNSLYFQLKILKSLNWDLQHHISPRGLITFHTHFSISLLNTLPFYHPFLPIVFPFISLHSIVAKHKKSWLDKHRK